MKSPRGYWVRFGVITDRTATNTGEADLAFHKRDGLILFSLRLCAGLDET